MASSAIDRRSNGRYRARYQDPNRRWRSRTFDRKVDAQRWLNDELTKVARGEWVDPRAGRITFGVVAERWMASRSSLRESTKARDRSLLDSLILPRFANTALVAIRPSDLEAFVADLTATGKAPATIRKVWQVVSGVFNLAIRDRLVALTPARDVRLPKVEVDEPRALTVDEVMELAEAMDPRYRALVLVGAFGGLRLGELAGLQVGDFDPLHRQLRVRRTVSDVRGHLIEGPPKTPKSMRTVTLPKAVVEELTSHLGTRSEVAATDWIFPAPEGGPIRRTGWVRRHWRPALRAAGLDDDLGTHTLRHSHVALLIAQGEHPKVIADRLGHTSVKTVLDVYGHLYEGADGDAADRLDEQIAAYSRPDHVMGRVVDLRD